MERPNYFLADLPPDAPLNSALIVEACQSLQRNRQQHLVPRSTRDIIRTLSRVAQTWLDHDNPLRLEALHSGPALTGFSRATLEHGLDQFFRRITSDALLALIGQDLGDTRRLDEFWGSTSELREDRAAIARGPEFLVHIGGGQIPNPIFTSIFLGLLIRSAQFVKCPSGTSFFPRLLAHSIYQEDPKLASCIEIAEWKGGLRALEDPLFHAATVVTATGSDETLRAIRNRLPDHARLVTHGHRVSFAYIANEALSILNPEKIVARAAEDVVAWDQAGCLSPHVIYVETGGGMSPEQFAESLGRRLAEIELSRPRGSLPTDAAAAIATRRSFYQVRAAHSLDTKVWHSRDSTAWTVVYENDPRFQCSCLNRFIYVKAVTNPEHVIQGADAVSNHVSTVGLAAPDDRAPAISLQFAQWGATRICPLGRMQDPPLSWRHDGRPALGDLILWTDWEQL